MLVLVVHILQDVGFDLGRLGVLVHLAHDLDGHDHVALLVQTLEYAAERAQTSLSDDLVCRNSMLVSQSVLMASQPTALRRTAGVDVVAWPTLEAADGVVMRRAVVAPILLQRFLLMTLASRLLLVAITASPSRTH